jgi:hypothetical protein
MRNLKYPSVPEDGFITTTIIQGDQAFVDPKYKSSNIFLRVWNWFKNLL